MSFFFFYRWFQSWMKMKYTHWSQYKFKQKGMHSQTSAVHIYSVRYFFTAGNKTHLGVTLQRKEKTWKSILILDLIKSNRSDCMNWWFQNCSFCEQILCSFALSIGFENVKRTQLIGTEMRNRSHQEEMNHRWMTTIYSQLSTFTFVEFIEILSIE